MSQPGYPAPVPGDPRPPYYQQHPPQPRPPPPPPQYGPPPPHQQHPAYAGNPGASTQLPPIQQHNYPPPGAPESQNRLPPIPPPQQIHDVRDGGPEYQYNQHNRSGQATPAPRPYSHDQPHQRTPSTPVQPQLPYPPTSAPEGVAPQQPPQHMEVHPNYPPTNGVTHGQQPPPHGLPPPQHGPPPPGHHDPHAQQYAMTPVMDNSHSYPPPHVQPMYQGFAPTSYNANVQRKKQMRATQACEQCRQRKQKCDEGNPCSFCKENNLTCQYRDTPPAKTDKNMEKVIGYLESIVQSNSELKAQNSDLDSRLRRMEQQQMSIAPTVTGKAQQALQETEDDETPVKRKPAVDDHRTAPHKLILLWPSVGPLLAESGVTVNDGYVMEAEDRGVLRLYGRGEGIDEQDGTQPGGPASPARSEDSASDHNAPTPPEGIWGRGFTAYSHMGTDTSRSYPYTAGGLRPDGSLDLDEKTINKLFDSYIKHMHKMHPFLDKQRTRILFDKFIQRYSPQRQLAKSSAFAVGSNESDRPLKRQRSNGSNGQTGIANDYVTKRPPMDTERSPSNAIVYLVLALGKICAHAEPLPSIALDRASNTNQVLAHQLTGNFGFTGSSPVSASIKPSPYSPKLTPNTQPTPPADAGTRIESRSRRSSFDGSSPSMGPKNMDIIPGIAYFAKAAEILGDQGDGNDLVHAQMFLLAGLYKGQLGRVKESMSWITMAGRACQILLDRYKLYNDRYWTAYSDVKRQHEKGQMLIADKRQNLIVLASWTAVQLESDILAELRLPSSGIQSIEHLLLMPHNREEDNMYIGLQPHDQREADSYNSVLMFYTAQLFLRMQLNRVHREMYGPECLDKSLTEVQNMLEGHEAILSGWRQLLPPGLKWDDSEKEPKDILSARLRAKYWGARYVINRPFLDYALHIMKHVPTGSRQSDSGENATVETVAVDVNNNLRDKADIHLFKAIQGLDKGVIWEACRRCIEAAMRSTVAFDEVPDRLVVTNIHGTAHAQFGNMLVLAAVYYDKTLKRLIEDVPRFKRLLDRTIRFLRRLAPISPTCANDCSILEKIRHRLFGLPDDVKEIYQNEVEPPSAQNSFHSAST